MREQTTPSFACLMQFLSATYSDFRSSFALYDSFIASGITIAEDEYSNVSVTTDTKQP